MAAILGFGMILAIFDLQITPILPTKFQVNGPFSSEEERKNKFLRWGSTSQPDAFCQVLSQLAFSFRRRSEV